MSLQVAAHTANEALGGNAHLPLARPDERYQLTQLKEQLAEALGDDGPLYWSALRDFVQGRLNRQEFDFYAYLYLSGDKASLHNQFIMATIHNAQSGQAPPEGERNEGFESRRKRKSEEDGDPQSGEKGMSKRSIKALLEDPKWRYVKELVKSLNKNERRAIKTLLKRADITPEEAHSAIRSMKPVVLPLPAAQLPQSYAMDIAKGITAPLVYDTKATPDIESLSYRMVAIALEQGLSGGVTREAGELLLYALDCHLKNIVSNMIYKTRSNRALGIPVSNARPPSHSSSNVSAADSTVHQKTGAGSRPTTGGLRLRERLYHSKSTLHLSDLVFSLDLSPSTTVEPPLCLERCANLMANQVLAEDYGDDVEDESQSDMFPQSSSALIPRMNAIGISGASSVGNAGGVADADAADGFEDDAHKHRRKVRRLRARYERWFGPYVNVQYGSNAQNES
ncbi:hypothetical protein J3B02_001894 [Coemansia erecta]|uniref:Uncharacterized protein n=1 Tax=Coemansia asiatica TaxID=1052880 RepID=A0A9W7XP20_9FUNG|nr:hypothetical protein LPJ64_001435 [Coemansia asiatica]KAJ2855931.1 hypothetical protein J3B02_001894 [Coemansia erecta]KAJ2883557.1 hypothetical protein FB639_002147 [Coemansia asiatica]